ncbi:MAG: phosphatase PAP2 family protein [Agathobacter sp.]|nr:phosphatase PAP2 family protein [Agathobacter sp.]
MSWEFDFLYALQNIHNPVLDKIMIVLSTIGDAGLLWIGVAILLICMKKYRKCGLQVAVAMLLTFIVGNLILKNMIHRDRPCWIDPSITLLVKLPSDFSFPSGHSMNGFTASVSILLCDKKLGIAAVILAAAIAFSRLYNFVHFPTDVIAGIVIGIVSALFVNYLFQRKVHV